MKILLLQDVAGLGNLGDEVNVKPGYFRNYIQLKYKSVVINKINDNLVEVYRKKLAHKRQHSISLSQDLADKLANLKIVFVLKASKEGTLFGAVNEKLIYDQLEQNGIVLQNKKAIKSEHIKKVGKYVIPIQIHSEVTAELNIHIQSEHDVAKMEKDTLKSEKEAIPNNIEPVQLKSESEKSAGAESTKSANSVKNTTVNIET